MITSPCPLISANDRQQYLHCENNLGTITFPSLQTSDGNLLWFKTMKLLEAFGRNKLTLFRNSDNDLILQFWHAVCTCSESRAKHGGRVSDNLHKKNQWKGVRTRLLPLSEAVSFQTRVRDRGIQKGWQRASHSSYVPYVQMGKKRVMVKKKNVLKTLLMFDCLTVYRQIEKWLFKQEWVFWS